MDNHQYLAVNLARVVNDTSFSSITRLLAMKLQKQPYMTLQEFFRDQSANDLMVLGALADGAMRQEDQAAQELILISEMLSRAEGCEPQNTDEAIDNLSYLVTLIATASLERRGFVEITWGNVSFGKEFANKDFVRLKPGFSPDML